LREALSTLDAVAAFATRHRLSIDQLYEADISKRLRVLQSPKSLPPIHPLLATITDKNKKSLSACCYKIQESEDDFDNVLKGLQAYYRQKTAGNRTSKGEVIDSIICSGEPKNLKAVGKVLWVIGSLALLRIRDADARAVATQRGHKSIAQGDKTTAADGMWEVLHSYNPKAERTTLDERINAGIRWDTFLSGKEIGIIVAVHKLPSSLLVFYPGAAASS